MARAFFRWSAWALGVWVAAHLGLVIAAWAHAKFAPIDPIPQEHALDLRGDRAQAGRVVTIVATRPTPTKGDWIGHLWIAWPETPPGAPAGTRESGYYAQSQLQAAAALAGALVAPWGAWTGQPAVPGLLKVDDGWWRHVTLAVRVDESAYRAALGVDARWRAQTRYVLRPAAHGPEAGRTFGCQDYVFDVAEALGLKTGPRDWRRFPMGSFRDFAAANGIHLDRGPEAVR
jgi:hypothetical protein